MMSYKSLKKALVYPFLSLTFLLFILFQTVSASTITGTIYDPQRNPLQDVDVELLDDLYRQIDRARTDGTGRYSFGNLQDGNYTVRVMPFRYDYLDQSQYVEIKTMNIRTNGTSNSYETRDFYLQPKKGSLADTELEVVFAQDVPKEAEKAYHQAVKDISKRKSEDVIAGLRSAISLYPNYFLALQQLGKILVNKGEYSEAAPLLIKAVEINSKSPTAFYYLGVALHKLNYNKAALTALTQAYTAAPSSMEVLLMLGTVERMEGKYTESEQHLLKAKKATKNNIPEIHWELAQLYGLNLKRYKDASEELEEYLKGGKYTPEHIKKIKKLISDFQEKAKSKTTED